MFVLESVQAQVEIRDQAEIDGIILGLERVGYEFTVRSLLRNVNKCVGLGTGGVRVTDIVTARESTFRRVIRNVPRGDISFSEGHAFLLQPIGPRLVALEIRHHLECSKLSDFCEKVEGKAKLTIDGRRLRGMQFDWQPYVIRERPIYRPGRAQPAEQTLDVNDPTYDETESDCAALISNSENREFLLNIARARGRLRERDTLSEDSDKVLEPLLERGLVRKEYLIQCRQDSHTICTIADSSQIEGAGNDQIKCRCGRAFKDESIHEIFALTELGQTLISGSKWMTIWITDLIKASGVNINNIGWSATASDDEIDITVDIHDLRIFLELKDRDFGLGDAYPFAARVSRYGGDQGIVVTMQTVDDEAKRYLSEEAQDENGVNIEMLQGRSEIERQLRELLDATSRLAIERKIGIVSDPFEMGIISPLLTAWMQSHKGKIRIK